MAAQMIMRRVYDDAGNLLREGLVDKNVPNKRDALLDWWAEQDQLEAQAAADEAAAEAERLAALEQEPANEAMAIPALAATVDEHSSQLEMVQQQLGQLQAAQPEEVLRLASQIQLGAGAAAALEASAQQVEQRIGEASAAAQERLSSLDQRQAESVGQIADLVIGARQQIELASAQAVADAKRQVASLMTTTTARVEALRGPRGLTGAAGAGIAVGAGAPKGPEATFDDLGRNAIVGDKYIDGSTNEKWMYRWDGKSWGDGPGPRFSNPPEIRDVKISSLDASTKVTSLQTISGSGGGGGGGGEHLLVNRIGLGAATAIGDTSNWAGISDIRSGIASVDLLALDGGNQGKTYAVELPFTWDTSGDQFTADGELGNLLGLYSVSLSVQRSAAVAPAVFTGVMPPGAQRLVTFLTVTPVPGGGGDTTQFRLSGSISYNHVAQGAAVSVQSGGLQPLWIWS
jgi:hypothetical protein